MKVSLVAALDRNRGIGRGNAMPWHLPDDFRHFRALTLGRPILMGRRTAQSLGRALPGRANLVLTRGTEVPFAGMTVVASLDQALSAAAAGNRDKRSVTRSPFGSITTAARPASASASTSCASKVDLPEPVAPMTCMWCRASATRRPTGLL